MTTTSFSEREVPDTGASAAADLLPSMLLPGLASPSVGRTARRFFERLRAGLLFAAACGAASLAWPNADYPTRPVRVVIPSPAGSSPDVIARIWANKLGRALGQPVVIDNRPGAATIIGAQMVATAPADGYTFLYTVGSTTSINPAVYPKLPYRFEDFVGVVRTVTVPYVLVVSAASPFGSTAELVGAARKTPGKLNYASHGVGQTTQVVMARFLQAADARMTHVPYKDGGIPDLISGRVAASFEPSTTAIPQIAAGRLRGLAVTGTGRLPVLPNVPTVAEWLPGFEADSWQGLLAPKGTPPAVIDRIAALSQEILGSTEFQARSRELGLMPVHESPAEFQKFMADDARVWAKVVKDNDIRAD